MNDRVLVMDARLRNLAADTIQLRPSRDLAFLQEGTGAADGQVVCAGPGRGIFYVVVAGHVLGDDGDAVFGILGEDVGGCEADDAGAGGWLGILDVSILSIGIWGLGWGCVGVEGNKDMTM